MKKFLDEFKQFAVKGNVLDMAIGVVIGGAFTAIVTSLVNDIIMPFIALITGNVAFGDLALTLKGDITLNYGAFIQCVVNFVLVALVLFFVVKAINKMNKPKEEVKEEPKKPEQSEELKALKKIIKLLEKKN